jgi:hypothetical protein
LTPRAAVWVASPQGGHLADQRSRSLATQRDALYDQIRNCLASLENVVTALEPQGDLPTAGRVAGEFGKDFLWLKDIDWHDGESWGEIEPGMPTSELAPRLRRLREEAKKRSRQLDQGARSGRHRYVDPTRGAR